MDLVGFREGLHWIHVKSISMTRARYRD